MRADLTMCVVPALVGLAVALVLGRIIIPVLHRLNFGQYIREEGPASHKKKAGTPTMGGIIFLLAMLAGCLCFPSQWKEFWIVPAMTFGFGAVGLIDDIIKEVLKHNEGLKAWQKFLLQFLLAVVLAIYLGTHGYGTDITFHNGGSGVTLHLGWFYYVLVIIGMLGLTNGTNFTDGLDGLCSSVTAVICVFLTICAYLSNSAVQVVSSALLGALCGFLFYNAYPAQVFMGDTGSLALGGFVGSMIFLLDMPLLVLVFGFIYVLEVVSVMLQVAYFKATHGKRLFLMAPIHHHFEKKGWHEVKVVARFTVATVLLCLISLLLY